MKHLFFAKNSTLKKRYVALNIISLIITLWSCAPAYIPNVINTPMMSNKGEFRGAAHIGTAGFDPQLSYAITDNIGVLMNASFSNSTSDSTDSYHKHHFLELGTGYYKKINHLHIEVFGGYGFGKIKSHYNNNIWNDYTDVNIQRYFLQPSVGFGSNYFDAIFTPRVVHVNIAQSTQNNRSFFIEPAITLKFGPKHVKFIGQMGLSFPYHNSQLDFEYNPFLFSTGIQINLGKKEFKNMKQPE
ncbi:MAG: hypothetical protein JW717_00835 [Marinilabiliaceae bacterium]|nr:hypothetical protein [Marinilabiliaceae bacterium]